MSFNATPGSAAGFVRYLAGDQGKPLIMASRDMPMSSRLMPKAALKHAEASEKAKANLHNAEAIKHLKESIDQRKQGNAVEALGSVPAWP